MFSKVQITLFVLIAAAFYGASAQSSAAKAICGKIQAAGNEPKLNGQDCTVTCCQDEDVCQGSIFIQGKCENEGLSAAQSQQTCAALLAAYGGSAALSAAGCSVTSCGVSPQHVNLIANC